MSTSIEIREWPDASGEDDHGRSTDGLASKQESKHGIKVGDKVSPNDSNEIHTVLSVRGNNLATSPEGNNGIRSLKADKVTKLSDNGTEKRALQRVARERALKIQANRAAKLSKESAMTFEEKYAAYIVYRQANAAKLLVSEGLATMDSYDGQRCAVQKALNANIMAGVDMDGDDDGPQDAMEGAYAYIQDMYADKVVYSMSNCLFQCDYSIDSDGDAHLGEPVEVQTTYEPVSQESAKESFKESSLPFQRFDEAVYDASKGQLTLTVIRPGLSKNDRYYSADLLRSSVNVFENARMFADHYTDKQSSERPEGSIRDWVGSMTKVWAESDGTLKGTAVIIDPGMKEKLAALKEAGLLNQMGVSIRAAGTASAKMMEGRKVKFVESLDHCRSVDFVTFAGAGGQVEDLQ